VTEVSSGFTKSIQASAGIVGLPSNSSTILSFVTLVFRSPRFILVFRRSVICFERQRLWTELGSAVKGLIAALSPHGSS
jgi:hypothetical protein